MTLGDVVRGAGNTSKKVGKVAAGAAVYGASMLGMVSNAKAIDRNIYPADHATTPWTIDQADRYMHAATCAEDGGGPYSTPCPVAGDSVVLNDHDDGTTGDYHVPEELPSRSLTFDHDNVNLVGDNVRIYGSIADLSQKLIKTYSEGTTVTGIVFIAPEGTQQVGVQGVEGFRPENPVKVTANEFYGFRKAAIWNNLSAPGDNSTAGFEVTNNYISDVFFGSIFNKGSDSVDGTKIRGLFSGNTVVGCNGVGYTPLLFGSPEGINGRSSTGVTAPGIEETTGNVFQFSDGATLDPLVLGALVAASGRSVNAEVPFDNIEYLMGKNPAEGLPYLGPLQDFFPSGNNVAGINPELDIYGKPKETSLIVLDRKAGSGRPAGDAVGQIIVPGREMGDWKITKEDLYHFAQACLDNPQIIPGSLIPKAIQIHDTDEDLDVDMADYEVIVQNIEGDQPDCDGNGIGDFTEANDFNDLSTILENRRNAPASPLEIVASNRSFQLIPANNGASTAYAVTLTNLPQPYDIHNGEVRWLGPPEEISEAGSSREPVEGFPTFWASTLQCTPHYDTDWPQLTHVFGRAVIPTGSYSVSAVADGCDTTVAANFSPSTSFSAGVFGDITGIDPVDPINPPDGAKNISDTLAIIGRFSGIPTAPSKSRTDMEPGLVDFRINITDALQGIRAFQGLSYDLEGPEADDCQ